MSNIKQKSEEIRIHIDREVYKSTTSTTGAELYILGSIKPKYQIYREVHGNNEDEPIFNDGEEFYLKKDDHFYSTPETFKGFAIVVNAKKKLVYKRELSYLDVVALAFENPPNGENVIITITYRHAAGNKHQGILLPGQTVKIKNGTVFNVTATDKS
jgi:hypothetical protein